MTPRPDFLIIGVQKGGTTSLHSYLTQHPQIAMASLRKELHYFDREKNKPYPEHSWYLSQFSHDDTLMRGETTPAYCYHPQALNRIYEFDPKLKLIMILRNPVNRAISHYWMSRSRNQEKLPMWEAFTTETERLRKFPLRHKRFSYLVRGKYIQQINRIHELFPEEQLLLIKSEDLQREPQPTLKHVTDFLNIEDYTFDTSERLHQGDYPRTDPAIQHWLHGYFYEYNIRLQKQVKMDVREWNQISLNTPGNGDLL